MNKIVFLFIFVLVLGSVGVNAGFSDFFNFFFPSSDSVTGQQSIESIIVRDNLNCDVDNDGYDKIYGGCGGNDCKPYDSKINPGAVEICYGGVDNDCDGLIDCADPDCSIKYYCGDEICDDNYDNDGDGLFNMDDDDCENFGSDGLENSGGDEPCGDGFCGATESCGTCPLDCGPCSFCGNGILNIGEDCDNGVNNGVLCIPNYGSSCVYCNGYCINSTVVGGFCGDGVVNGLEKCDGGSISCSNSTGVGTKSCKSDCTWNSCVIIPSNTLPTTTGTGEICSNRIDDDNDCPGDTNGEEDTCGIDGTYGDEVCCPGDIGVDCLDSECIGATDGYGVYVCCAVESDCVAAGTYCDANYGICGEDNCGDSLDNDGDEFSDCYDWDCSTDSLCEVYYGQTEFDCGDGFDNDINYYVDCYDWACSTDSLCEVYYGQTEFDCGDGFDNNMNLYIDCYDVACKYDAECVNYNFGGDFSDGEVVEICDNGLDDDGDKLFDCDDYECYNNFICLGTDPDLSLGQEICGDGFDNDFDTFTDCYDSECPPCTGDDNYVGTGSNQIQYNGVITNEEKVIIGKNLELIADKLPRISDGLSDLEKKYKLEEYFLEANRVRVLRLKIQGVMVLMFEIIQSGEDMDSNKYLSLINQVNNELEKIVVDLKKVSNYESFVSEY